MLTGLAVKAVNSTAFTFCVHIPHILRPFPAAGLPTAGLAARTTLEEEDLEEEGQGRDVAVTIKTQVSSQQWSRANAETGRKKATGHKKTFVRSKHAYCSKI